MAEDAPSTADVDVLGHAVREARVLLTFDKDFGELAFARGLPAECGIVLLRLPPVPDTVARQILKAIASGVMLIGRFVVIESSGTLDGAGGAAIPCGITVSTTSSPPPRASSPWPSGAGCIARFQPRIPSLKTRPAMIRVVNGS